MVARDRAELADLSVLCPVVELAQLAPSHQLILFKAQLPLPTHPHPDGQIHARQVVLFRPGSAPTQHWHGCQASLTLAFNWEAVSSVSFWSRSTRSLYTAL